MSVSLYLAQEENLHKAIASCLSHFAMRAVCSIFYSFETQACGRGGNAHSLVWPSSPEPTVATTSAAQETAMAEGGVGCAFRIVRRALATEISGREAIRKHVEWQRERGIVGWRE